MVKWGPGVCESSLGRSKCRGRPEGVIAAMKELRWRLGGNGKGHRRG